MTEDVVLAFDVGGTHTRSKVGAIRAGGIEPHEAYPETTTRISSTRELYGHITALLGRLGPARVVAAALDIAGPIEGGTRARMTNWDDPEPILVDALVGLGLPRGRTELINDLFAGALGLVALLRREGETSPSLVRLHAPVSPPEGHLVFIAPGTGLGSAGIVRIATREGSTTYLPVACEVQHTPVPPFDPDVAAVAERVSMRLGRQATWEDLVSGRGLPLAYAGVCELRDVPPEAASEAVEAGWMADRAAEDAVCAEAFDVYYRCAGRFAQMLALTFLPCGGVFLGGASTAANRGIIEGGRFLDEFLDNPVQGQLLRATPVSLLLAEVNLDGALAQAGRLARERVVVGTTS